MSPCYEWLKRLAVGTRMWLGTGLGEVSDRTSEFVAKNVASIES